MVDVSKAAAAYTNALKNAQGQAGATGQDAAKPGNGPSFGDLMTNAVENAIDAQHNSEQVSAEAVVGKADLTDVVQAVTNAELTLNTVIAVRDRVINAYNQIMRMPV